MSLLEYLPALVMLLGVVGLIVFLILYLKSFYSAQAKKQKQAEELRQRHGGESVLEWSGSYAEGEPDGEFGRLVVVIPKKLGEGSARFYEKGMVVDKKRLPYSQLKNIVYAGDSGGAKLTAKQAVRDSAVMWIYPQKGSAFGIRGLTYRMEDQVMRDIQKGLGFGE